MCKSKVAIRYDFYLRPTLKSLLKKLLSPFLKWRYLQKTKKVSTYSYKDIHIQILPGVFHPSMTFSTRYLIDYLGNIPLKNSSFLELGAGNGLISFFAAKKGAFVTSTDISNQAIKGLELNSTKLNLPINIIESNLFTSIPKQEFDWIVINPPYYSINPTKEIEQAFYAGENLEYFEQLFSQLSTWITNTNTILMILSEDCEINRIKSIAKKNRFNLSLEKEYFNFWEKDYIFRIISKL